ncbi:DotI/IcmL/TraM family protein [Massilia atriviolacea]|uniref:Conjugal transfer protein TraM n=2 Tax=Massilia atriviolacea TaxID=2495579 RepID=A0A430HCL9_9BURK|nr:hypothetical protein EJB06_30425 [Massilia atriviolacea]
MFSEILDRLHQTHDAVDPGLRQEKERKHVQLIAGASVKLNFILVGTVALLAVSNLFLGWHAAHPDRQYFAADNGRIFPMIPMSQPYRKTADVIQYAKDNVTRSFTMDFLNWRQQLEDVRPGYTRDGFKSFLEALKASGVLETVKEKRMNMSISAGTGVLTKEGTENGVYQWIVELPIEVRLEGQTTRLPAQRFLTTVRIERVPTLDSIEGIGIGQLVTSPL